MTRRGTVRASTRWTSRLPNQDVYESELRADFDDGEHVTAVATVSGIQLAERKLPETEESARLLFAMAAAEALRDALLRGERPDEIRPVAYLQTRQDRVRFAGTRGPDNTVVLAFEIDEPTDT